MVQPFRDISPKPNPAYILSHAVVAMNKLDKPAAL